MPIIAVPSKGSGGLNEFLNPRFGKSDSITLVSTEHKKIKAVKIIPIHSAEAIGNLGIHIAEIIGSNKASDAIVRYIGHKAFQSLKAQKVQIYYALEENLTIKQYIDLFIRGKLSKLAEPNAHLINE
jgi:predicted Fe-Mo cluster-binding NifX family protein